MGTITRTAGLILSGFFGIGFVSLALITLLPAAASKPNLLGYYGVCSWAPNSTALLIVFAAASFIMALRIRTM
ncbi:MAG: hypothetical protein NWF12_00475 [Candidatus Bathyarchaeota archaeon]|jgi:hypothetical protein|nr:hypothetical protein [Candidatus Bathyarchaeota archaeon]